jgi:hypothetical protein
MNQATGPATTATALETAGNTQAILPTPMPNAAPAKGTSVKKQTVNQPRKKPARTEQQKPAEDHKYDALKKAWGG